MNFVCRSSNKNEQIELHLPFAISKQMVEIIEAQNEQQMECMQHMHREMDDRFFSSKLKIDCILWVSIYIYIYLYLNWKKK